MRFSLRSSFSNSINLRSAYRRSSSRRKNVNSDSLSDRTGYYRGSVLSGTRGSSYKKSVTSLKDINIISNTLPTNISQISKKNYEEKAVNNFKVINNAQESLNKSMPKWLEEAGVPSDVKFEFDYNIDTQKAEVTKISDDKYRESVETVINEKMGKETLYTAYASRIMNGYISSAYYSDTAKNLESCFGQDIDDLYLDKNGNIMGANTTLQRVLKTSKSGRKYASVSTHKFPAENIEGLLKRLLSDKKITPNVSHMGYDGKSTYTNDGKFKLGKNSDSTMLKDSRYIMRGSIALYGNNSYDSWIENEKLF
ncbi:MAG: hypothetical protein K2H23_00995 [Oscillospiraceae bacterium]|nr:hypothetical protein [Oscillospiraceae bacterium]